MNLWLVIGVVIAVVVVIAGGLLGVRQKEPRPNTPKPTTPRRKARKLKDSPDPMPEFDALPVTTPAPAPVPTITVSGNSFRVGGTTSMRVNGVAGSYSQASLALLKSWGGNTIRTYTTNGLKGALDMAQAQGLYVIVGLSSGLEKDEAAEITRIAKLVDTYKSHPAVLCWNIGNEQEHGYKFKPDVVKGLVPRLNAIATAIKARDSTHPVMNTFIDFGSNGAASPILAGLKAGTTLDLIGLNTYTSAPSLASRYASWNMPVPFLVTELGWAPGMLGRQTTWAQKDTSDAKITTFEKTSTEKAEHFAKALSTLYASPQCLGTVSFRWEEGGQPTGTWHMIFTPDMKRTSIGDVLVRIWSGKNLGSAPAITSTTSYTYRGSTQNRTEKTWKGIVLSGVDAENRVSVSTTVKASITTDRRNVPVTWILKKHNVMRNRKAVQGEVVSQRTGGVSYDFRLPAPGPYRLYAFLEDQGSVAYASVPLLGS